MSSPVEGRISGSLDPHLTTDVLVLVALADVSLDAAFASVVTAPSGGDAVIELRTATGGGGTLLTTLTITDGTVSDSWAGTVAVSSGTSIYMRPTATNGAIDLVVRLDFDAPPLFATIADVKVQEGLTTANKDALLTDILRAVTKQIQEYTGRTLLQATHTAEKYDGPGWSDQLVLKEAPVQSVSAVRVAGATIQATDYELEENHGILLYSPASYPESTAYWPRGRRNIEVDYVSGFTSVPETIKQATIEQVRHVFTRTQPSGADRLGVSQKVTDGGQVSYVGATLLDQVREALAPYRGSLV